MLSPVWMPIGSMFSIEHTMMQLSALSRTTSISYSFHPSTLSSISTSVVGLASRPPVTMVSNSVRLNAMPPPVPPSVKDGRITAGKPTPASASRASASVCAIALFGDKMPISAMASRNFSRSSARSITSALAPINSTPCRASAPFACNCIAVFSAVCPPMVGSSASGFSRAMIFSTTSGVIGST